jgi:hypothetical protein
MQTTFIAAFDSNLTIGERISTGTEEKKVIESDQREPEFCGSTMIKSRS